MSSDEEDYGVKFYLDDDEKDEGTFDHEFGTIMDVTSVSMDRISAFMEQLTLNSSDITTYRGQSYFRQAIITKRMDIVQKFIEYQVDLNACDDNNWTPLHYAVSGNNIECVCLLLSYGVDVRIKSVCEVTPLTLAFKLKCKEIIKVLLNYYYEFSNVNVTNMKLDSNHWFNNHSEDIVLLALAMDNDYVEPFKLIWNRNNVDEIMRELPDYSIQKYLCNSMYAPAKKTDCLYSTIEMDDIGYMLGYFHFFLHKAFLSKNFDQTRRMDLLFMFLSTGVKLHIFDIDDIFQVCGFNNELEALIYAGNFDWDQFAYHYYNNVLYYMLSFHFITNTYHKFCKEFKYNMDIDYPNDLIPWLKYFSLPSDVKCKNVNLLRGRENTELLLNYLREVSEFPSLLELGRLAVQNLIKQTNNISKPYQFHDAVKNLCLPQYLEDIVLFKRPIYR